MKNSGGSPRKNLNAVEVQSTAIFVVEIETYGN
jgi:hypothetical protein